MKLLYQTFTVLIALLVLTHPMSGQEVIQYDHNFISATSPWLYSSNAAGLGTMPVSRFGYVEARFGKQNGGLCGINDSADSFDAGVQTESFIKISDKVHLYGNLEYNYFKGKNMGGPILMDPSYNPINFYEDADTTVGIRNKEIYHLIGGISYNLNDKWSIGGKINYESADRTKMKDPRFLTVWMDLGVSAGFRYAPTDAFSLGLNLAYRRTLEQVDGEIIGLTDEKYFTFIDLGGFYGSRELFDGSNGYVPVSETRPMFNSFYGGALQIEAGKDTKIFNEISFMRRDGYYGKRSSTTVVYTEHSSNIIGYHGILLTGNKANRHRVGLDFTYEGLNNTENIYRMNSEVGEYTVVEYFGQNEVLKRTDIHASLFYTGYLGITDFRPVWEFGASADFNRRSSLTTIYPFYRNSSLSAINANLYGIRSLFVQQKNLLTLGVQGNFAMGFGDPKMDGTLASSSSAAPRSADTYLNKDFEYKTAMQAGGCVTVRYTRFFKKNIAFYVEAKDRFDHLLKKAEYLPGNYRNILEVKVGCTF